jgi:phosphopantothenoylcysteine decarboxylase
MSANLLGKVVGGLCDNLLTNVMRAWDVGGGKTVLPTIMVAPAMNDRMYAHPLTAKHLAVLEEWEWFEVLQPQVKLLACGDLGQGGMHDWNLIVKAIEKRLPLLVAALPKDAVLD